MLALKTLLTLCALFAGVASSNFELTAVDYVVSADNSYPPEVQTLANGDVVVCWFNRITYGIEARIYTNANPTVGGEIISVFLGPNFRFQESDKKVAAMAHGGFFVAFYDGDNNGLYYREYSSSGTPMTPTTVVVSSPMVKAYSCIGLESGEGVIIYDDAATNTIQAVNLGGASAAIETGLSGRVALDLIEVDAGLLCVYSNSPDIYYVLFGKTSPFAPILSSSFQLSPTIHAWDSISLKKTYGRPIPLITLAASSSDGDETWLKLWGYSDAIPEDSVEGNSALMGRKEADHLTLGIIGSTINVGQTLVISQDNTFIYYDNTLANDLNSIDGYFGYITRFSPRGTVSVAQLGANGWFVGYYGQLNEVMYSYYHVPETTFAEVGQAKSGMSSCSIDTGGYAVFVNPSTVSLSLAVFDDNDNQLFHRDGIVSGSQPSLLNYPNTNLLVLVRDNAGTLATETYDSSDLTLIDSATGPSFGSSHTAKILNSALVVAMVSGLRDSVDVFFGADLATTHTIPGVGGSISSTMDIETNNGEFIAFWFEGNDLYRCSFSESASDPPTLSIANPIQGQSPPEEVQVIVSEGSEFVYITTGNGEVYQYVHGISESLTRLLSGGLNSVKVKSSLTDNSVYITGELNEPHSFTKDADGIAMARVHNWCGIVLEEFAVVNNFVIGEQGVPGLAITPRGPVLSYTTAVTGASSNPVGAVLAIPITDVSSRTEEATAHTNVGVQHSAHSCHLSTGGVIVVWEEGSGGLSSVYAQIFDSVGAPTLTEQVLISGSSSNSNSMRPRVACFYGGYYITWLAVGGSGTSVYVSKFDDTGRTVEAAEIINPMHSGISTGNLDIATTLLGDKYVVVWDMDVETGDGSDVYMRVVTPGESSPLPSVVHNTVALTQKNPSVTMSDDSIVVSWQSFGQDGSSYGVFARRFTDEVPVSAEFQVNILTTSTQAFAKVAFFSDKRFVIVWGSYSDSFNVMGAFYATDGTREMDIDMQLNSETSVGNDRPSCICVFPDDSFIIGWNRYESDSVRDAYYRRFTSRGRPSSGDTILNTYTNRRQYDPTIALLNHGKGFFAAWTSNFQDTTGSGIYSYAHSDGPAVFPASPNSAGYTGSNLLSKTLSTDLVIMSYFYTFGSTKYLRATLIGLDGSHTSRDILQVSDTAYTTHDIKIVNDIMYLMIHDGSSYTFVSTYLNLGVGGTPIIPSSFTFSTVPALTSSATDSVNPKIFVDPETSLILLFHRDGSSVVGNTMYVEIMTIPLYTPTTAPALFPIMEEFYWMDVEYLKSGYVLLANVMGRSGRTKELYLSVVAFTNSNVEVRGSVLLTDHEDDDQASEILVMSEERVIVCYAARGSGDNTPIRCQQFLISIGSDAVFFTKVGDTLKTALYVWLGDEVDFLAAATIDEGTFAVAGGDYEDTAGYVKIYNTDFEVLGSYTMYEGDFSPITSLARYQSSGLVVSYSHLYQFATTWVLPSPLEYTQDSSVPTEEIFVPEGEPEEEPQWS